MGADPRGGEFVELVASAIDASADGLLVVGLDGRVQIANARFAQLWRIPPDLLTEGDERAMLEYACSQVREPDRFMGKVGELYAQPEAESFDVLEFVDGRVFERYSRPQRVGARVTGRVWSFREVTDRRLADRRLAGVQERYRVLVEQIPAVTYADAADGTPLYVSPQIEELFGCSRQQWLGDTRLWLSMVHGDDRERAEAWYAEHLATGHSATTEYRVVRPDGSVRWVHERVALVCDADGSPTVRQGVIIDVTESTLVQAELSNARERYRALVEDLPALTYLYDTHGRCLYVAPQVASMFGCSEQEWMDGAWRRLIRSDDLEPALASAREATSSGGTARLEYRIDHPTRGTRWMAERLRVVRTDPDGVSVVQGLIIDVTERREAEEALNQSERLRDEVLASLLRAEAEERNRIAAELHDDTVQELVAAQISIDRMLPLTVPPLTDRLRDVRELLVETTERTRRLMFDLRPQTLHAAGVVAAIEALGAQLAGEAGFEFSVEGTIGRHPEHVEALLYRTLRELMLNARTHAQAQHLIVRFDQTTDQIMCEVEDDGIGFDYEHVRLPGPAGFHVGLTVAAERVALAGGTLTIQPGSPCGTLARTTLPYRQPE